MTDAPPLPTTSAKQALDNPDRLPAKDKVAAKRTEPKTLNAQNLSGLKFQKKSKTSQAPPAHTRDSITAPGVSSEANPPLGAMSPPQSSLDTRSLPSWYVDLDTKNKFNQKAMNRDLVIRLLKIRDAIKECKAHGNSADNTASFDFIRQELHEFMYFQVANRDKVYSLAIKKAKLLDEDVGLPQLFDTRLSGTVEFPWDIRADAHEIYRKWVLGDFDDNLLKGLLLGNKVGKNKEQQRNADKIDPNYPHREHANYYGSGNLLNGQWWPTQLATMRDGCHGSSQGGIHGAAGKGAFSIVLSGGNKYNDEDLGSEIWYSGTDGSNGQMTGNTRRMVESFEGIQDDNGDRVKHSVRVVRSHNLETSNAHRPDRGFRYDGLYNVVQMKVVDKEKQIIKFRLVRLPGQDPIRSSGPEKRPTIEEIQKYESIRKLIHGD